MRRNEKGRHGETVPHDYIGSTLPISSTSLTIVHILRNHYEVRVIPSASPKALSIAEDQHPDQSWAIATDMSFDIRELKLPLSLFDKMNLK